MGKLYVGNSGSTPAIIKVEEVPKVKFGLTVDTFLGDIDENGMLSSTVAPDYFDGTGIKILSAFSLNNAFYRRRISRVNLKDLELIYAYAGDGAFHTSGSKEIDLSNLTTISGDYACYNMFYNCSIDYINLEKLTTISGNYACQYMFSKSAATTIILNNLTTISGTFACQYMFQGANVSRVDFPSLTTVDKTNAMGSSSSNGMFANCNKLLEIHFRVDAQAVIESLFGYSSKFGAKNATIYFDL